MDVCSEGIVEKETQVAATGLGEPKAIAVGIELSLRPDIRKLHRAKTAELSTAGGAYLLLLRFEERLFF